MKLFLKKKLGLLLGALLIIVCIGFWVYQGSFYTIQVKKLHGIIDFNYERDQNFILDIFDKNWYWLIDDASSPNFSVEYMMRYLTTNNNPATAGRLTIKILYEHGKPAGFNAYYMKHFYLGMLRFVAVYEEFRSKGYGKKLVDYALQDLQSRGAAKVRLVTRTSNISAQKVYKASGMHVTEQEEGFVWFEKKFEV